MTTTYGIFCRGVVAQLVERPSKVTVWCNSTDVGSNHAAASGGMKNPSSAIRCSRYKSAVRFGKMY